MSDYILLTSGGTHLCHNALCNEERERERAKAFGPSNLCIFVCVGDPDFDMGFLEIHWHKTNDGMVLILAMCSLQIFHDKRKCGCESDLIVS